MDFGNILEQLKKLWDLFKGLPLTQKIVLIAVVVLILGGVIAMIFIATPKKLVPLYTSPLDPQDFARITKKLAEWGVKFETKEGKYILVYDDAQKQKLKMKLALEGLIPRDVKGWELFDVQKFTTTDFERNINLQRALIGEIEKHLRMLEDIEDARVLISPKKETLYKDQEEPITASVVITPTPYSDISENKKKIKAIIELVSHGIPGLDPQNIVVVDDKGNVLSDLVWQPEEDPAINLARKQLKIKESIRRNIISKVEEALSKALPRDRFIVSAEVELDWTKQSKEAERIVPIVVKEDNPLTPYDESQVEVEIPISKKEVKEEFHGPAHIPEGPPGVEANVPPGIKEKIDRFTKYQRNEEIVNYTMSKEQVKEEKEPYTIKRISVAVAIDGTWEIVMSKGEPVIDENLRIKRIYNPVPPEELKEYEKWVKSAIGFNPYRGDSVVVNNIKFDRTEQFEKEDEKIRRRIMLRKTLISAILVLIVLFLSTLLYRAIMQEVERRRRLREEELARQQQLMREAALKAAEEEGALVELSVEEKARMELLENVMNAVREKPDIAARVIRTWISEE